MRRKTINQKSSANYKNYDKTSDMFHFDSLDINIIKELLTKSNIRTADIAAKYKIPLSTFKEEEQELRTPY